MRKSDAIYAAAFNRLTEKAVNVRSEARDAYRSYRSTYDIAAQYQHEVLPLRKIIAEEKEMQPRFSQMQDNGPPTTCEVFTGFRGGSKDAVAMMPARPRHRALRQIFAWPAIIAVLSTIGLLSALLGDGIWDGVSWIVLAVPVALYYGFFRGGM
ncbi:hypothetical protein J2S34_000018 [Nitrobacter winogradskyi]|uniref:Uncharacterized protein n=1 Tax=Nitrobacter winogradskyi TaxID=913 RepID=A0ACC6AD50_NITWI|nr:hypothetical protein [Nitrobacter winogradskyi]